MIWMLLLGVSTGMRTLTATAVLCWWAWLGLLPQTGWSFWTGTIVSVVVFSLLALGEYVGDTLPITPNRTDAGPLAARILFGGFAGALGAHGVLEPVAGGILFGVVGVLFGAYGGYQLRTRLARRVGRDLPVALTESLLALGLALLAVWRLHVAGGIEGLFPR